MTQAEISLDLAAPRFGRRPLHFPHSRREAVPERNFDRGLVVQLRPSLASLVLRYAVVVARFRFEKRLSSAAPLFLRWEVEFWAAEAGAEKQAEISLDLAATRVGRRPLHFPPLRREAASERNFDHGLVVQLLLALASLAVRHDVVVVVVRFEKRLSSAAP